MIFMSNWLRFKFNVMWYRDFKVWAIIGLVITLGVTLPLMSIFFYNVGSQGAVATVPTTPQQKSQWCASPSTHYLGVWEWITFENETEKYIMKIHVNDTENQQPTLPANENKTFAVADAWIWDEVAPSIWDWTSNGTLRFPTNHTNFQPEQFLIPIAYNNYAMMKAMFQRNWEVFWSNDLFIEILNSSITHQETVVTLPRDINENAGFYEGEHIVEDSYLAVRYDTDFWLNYTNTNIQYHQIVQYIVEANTGIPLMQNAIFEIFSNSIVFIWLTLSFRTIATSIALPIYAS